MGVFAAAGKIENVQIIRETTPESGDILIHHEQTVQMLREVASGQREATLRMYQPNPTVAFGRRDELNPGFADAVAACEEHGFRTLVRKVGGHAAAYHRGCLVVDHFQPATDARSGNTVRYRLFGSMFAQALRELEEEGGVSARAARYAENNRLLIERMRALGFEPYLTENQGPIITTFAHPADAAFTFREMYDYVKARGYVIYPGKLTDGDTFRIGTIGEIYPADILNVTSILGEFVATKRKEA